MTAIGGSWRHVRGRRASAIALALIAAALPLTANASPRIVVAISPSTLDVALVTLARAGGVDIVSVEPGLRAVRTPALNGRMTVRVALDRLLADTGFRAVGIPRRGYRIVAIPVRVVSPAHRAAPPPAPPAPADVVVTASKQRVPLIRYPGTLTLIAGTPRLPLGVSGDTTDLTRILPVLQSTQLGPGRNKVFIRGVADSSFNGTTLSTVSVYLDDVQLSASAPDPGLRLYDMRGIEVMEGPQGTLYGAGSIGGVVRLTTNPPEADRVAAAVDVGVSAVQGGSPGEDLAAMINMPLIPGRLALRGVGYVASAGGYIDDHGRGARDVNRSDIAGGRLALRLTPGGGWRVDASGAMHDVRSRDGQYALADEGPLARRTTLAQPFAGDFGFGRLVVTKDWADGISFVSATGIAVYDMAETFDASMSTVPATLRLETDKLLVSHEMRLSGSGAGGRSWLAGVTLISDRTVLARSAGSPGNETDIVGVRNVTRAASAFGEGTVTLLRDLSVTLGGRYTVARVDSEPSQLARAVPYVKGQVTRRLDPTIALSYRLAPDLALFARHQTGFRTGGLAVARGVGRVANYDADSIDLNEAGVRRLRRGPTGINLSVSVSRARWRGIQADLYSRRGQPFTTNLGNATILGIEGTVDWVVRPGLTLSGSTLYTANEVTGPIADQSQRSNRRLADTPSLGGYLSIDYAPSGDRPFTPLLAATMTYVGRSVLGTGDLLDVSQGAYATVGASAGVRRRSVALTINVDNLFDRTANRFAFGNPFGLAARDQTTPLQPRTFRLGLSSVW
ncbi:TonB-dependent receptor domain-containing protein [uncultured Sphingomonas sp.]|uniref:TonB-dependent receptor domain-containing protein n=1 Tax=uncultured Sphingomonas sp. TaxID=158754 RepID=UPI0035CA7C27